MLQYWVELKATYPQLEIKQVVVYLKEVVSSKVYESSYTTSNLSFNYQVKRLWEEDPNIFLATPGLLPFAPLTKTNNPEQLLQEVVLQIDQVADLEQKKEIIACADILAGLRFNKTILIRLFQEEIMLESVTYREILQKGEQIGELRGLVRGRNEGRAEGRAEGKQEGKAEGLKEGLKEGKLAIIFQILRLKLGAINPELSLSIMRLSLEQMDALAVAIFNWKSESDLINWLNQNPPTTN